jgi:hypothetical protein
VTSDAIDPTNDQRAPSEQPRDDRPPVQPAGTGPERPAAHTENGEPPASTSPTGESPVPDLPAASDGENPPSPPPTPRRQGTWARASRWTAGVVVLLLAAVLGGVAVIATYVRDQVLDTNSYVSNVAPLSSDPQVQDALAARLSNVIVTQANLAGIANNLATRLVQQGAPQRTTDLVQPLVQGITSFLDNTIRSYLATPEFQRIWEDANRSAHTGVVAVLTGERQQGSAVSSTGTTVTVDLGQILDRVKQRLAARGLTFVQRIPSVSIPYTLVDSPKLPKIRAWVRAFNSIALWLPWVAVVLFVAGFLITPNRRRGILTGIIMLGAIDVLLLAVFAILRSYYIANLPPSVQSPPAATVLYDTVLRYLNTALQSLLVLVIVVIVAALFAGPSRLARWLRHQIGRGLDAAGHGLGQLSPQAPPVGRAITTIRKPLEIVLAAFAIVILIVATRPSPAAVGWLTLAIVGIIVIIEILARMAGAPAAAVAAEGAPATQAA